MINKKKHIHLPQHIKPHRYKISIKPDLQNFTFAGSEIIEIALDRSVKEIILHAAELDITEAECIQENYIVNASVSYDVRAETATLHFSNTLQKGKCQLKLTFTGVITEKMRGYYRSSYQHEGQLKHVTTTQFESTDARRAFPCFDEPAQKAIFEMSLLIPSHMIAISNTIESKISEAEEGYKIVEFAETPKMSTYLLAYIVGEFEHIEGKTKDGVLVRVFTTYGKKQQAKFALDVAIKCLEFYNNYFAIPYPLPTLDLIAIPDFAAGAMENWGAVTYRESTLLVDEGRTSTSNKQWVALVIAHELAHQWFGNLVTMEWWTHLWLNEGFASFIEYFAVDHIFPQWDIWKQFISIEASMAFQLDSLKNTHPIEVAVGHPAEINEIFDTVSYSKGASVLRMLWQYLGEEDFQKGIQHYLKKHAYANAKTEDLWEAFEEVSGKPVKSVMKNWTSKAGHPIITVVEQKTKLKLTQRRFFSSPISKKEARDNTVWSIPIITQNQKTKTQNYMLNLKTINIPKPKDGEWIKLNAGEASFFRVDYPHTLLLKLERAIQENKLPAVDRLGLIRDSFDLAQSGNSPTILALELIESFKQETDYIVWAEISARLDIVDNLLALEKMSHSFANFGQSIFTGIAGKIGWEKRSGEKHTDSLLRSLVLLRLGSFGHLPTIEKAKELFTQKNLDPDLRAVVYFLVAKNGGNDVFEKLVTQYKEEDNSQEKDRIGRSLGFFTDTTILSKTLDFSLSKHVRHQNSLHIIASVWHNPHGRYLAWDYVKKHWELLKKRYAGGHYFTRVFAAAGDFTKNEDADEMESFVLENPVPEARRTIAQSLEQIRSNAAWITRDKEKIDRFLVRNT